MVRARTSVGHSIELESDRIPGYRSAGRACRRRSGSWRRRSSSAGTATGPAIHTPPPATNSAADPRPVAGCPPWTRTTSRCPPATQRIGLLSTVSGIAGSFDFQGGRISISYLLYRYLASKSLAPQSPARVRVEENSTSKFKHCLKTTMKPLTH